METTTPTPELIERFKIIIANKLKEGNYKIRLSRTYSPEWVYQTGFYSWLKETFNTVYTPDPNYILFDITKPVKK